jgi:large subunit ribosomal protein L18
MKKKVKKLYLQKKKRSLKGIVGIQTRPRLAVFRSHLHIYAQLIDDSIGHTLACSSTLEHKKVNSQTKEASFEIGEDLAKKALEKNIREVIFDKGKRKYHGRVQFLADGARKGGLIF